MRLKIILLCVTIGSYLTPSVAQTSVKQSFFIKTLTKAKGGFMITAIKTPDGSLFRSLGPKAADNLFYINGKSYTETEAQTLDPSTFKTQRFKAVFAWDYAIAGRDLSKYIQIIYTGPPPPLSDFVTRLQAVHDKYTGKIITGVVKGPSYFSLNNRLSGFVLESGNETFQVNITMSEISRLMNVVKAGDIVIIEVGNATLTKDVNLPVIIPKTLTKDGERLIQKGSVQI